MNTESHKAKMARKKLERATMVPGWIKQASMPSYMEIKMLPKTDGKIDLRPKPSKNDCPKYRKAV